MIESKEENSTANDEEECYCENKTISGQRYARRKGVKKLNELNSSYMGIFRFLLQRTDCLIDDNIYLCYLRKYSKLLNATIDRVPSACAYGNFIPGKSDSNAQKSYMILYKRVLTA